MITRDPDAFLALARALPTDFGPTTARAAFLVAPDGFRLAEQSARDNAYMADAAAFDAARASAQICRMRTTSACTWPSARPALHGPSGAAWSRPCRR